jgi:hypothetical protein
MFKIRLCVFTKARQKLQWSLCNRFGSAFRHLHRRSGPWPAAVCVYLSWAQGYNTLHLHVPVTAVCTLKLRHVKCMLMSYSDSSLPCALSIIRQMGPLITKCVNSTSESQWLCLHQQRKPVGLLCSPPAAEQVTSVQISALLIYIYIYIYIYIARRKEAPNRFTSQLEYGWFDSLQGN